TAAASPGWKRRSETAGRSLIAASLVRGEAVAGDEEPEGPEQDAGVEQRAAVVDVVDVELDPLLPGDAGAALDLGPAGDARADLVAAALVRRVIDHLGRDRRAGADDRHLAAQDVEQVGDLVERGAAQDAAGSGDARVVAGDHGSDPDRVGALDHRAQLQ